MISLTLVLPDPNRTLAKFKLVEERYFPRECDTHLAASRHSRGLLVSGARSHLEDPDLSFAP
jgi:hypothetical protein